MSLTRNAFGVNRYPSVTAPRSEVRGEKWKEPSTRRHRVRALSLEKQLENYLLFWFSTKFIRVRIFFTKTSVSIPCRTRGFPLIGSL